MKKFLMLAVCALLTACGGSVSGTIAFDDNGDASGVVVSLVGKDTHVQVTGSNGVYKFDGVGDGTYQLVVDSASTTEPHKAIVISMAGGKGGAVPTITLTPVGTLTGMVTATSGQASGNTGIVVSVAGTDLRAITADDGSFSLPNVPAGARTLVATRGDYLTTSAVTVARGAQSVPAFALGKKSVKSGTVKGSVAYFDAKPANSISLSVPGSDVTGTPSDNGSFALTLPAGEWDVMATAPGYPKQKVAHVVVTADATTDIGVKRMTAYSRFHLNDKSQYASYSRLFDDGVHVLVSREGWENVSHSIANLQTGEERLFLVEWNYLTDPTQWVATNDGKFLGYGQNLYEYDSAGNGHYFSEFHVFNTTTGAHQLIRGDKDTSPANQQAWSFSTDSNFFFACDNLKLYRQGTTAGDITNVPADVTCMKADADHYLAFAKSAASTTVGSATLLTTTGANQVVTNVSVQAGYQLPAQFGQYAVMLTDCSASNCQVKVIDGISGNVRTASGGPYAQSSKFFATNHPNWVRIEGSKNAYLKLTDGNATAYPGATYTSGTGNVADTAKIDPSGTRVAFQIFNGGTSTYSLYVAPMPPTTIPVTVQDAGTTAYKFAWLSQNRFVGTNGNAASVLQLQADTRADVTDVIAGSVIINDLSAVWRRSSDRALVAEVADVAPFALTAADPNLETTIAVFPYYTTRASIFTTKNKTWTAWTIQNNTNGRYSIVARRASDGVLKTHPDMTPRWFSGTADVSETGMLATARTFDYQDVALDLESGLRRQIWEVDLDDESNGTSGVKVGQEYLMGSFLTGDSTQQYNGSGGLRSTYDTGVLKY